MNDQIPTEPEPALFCIAGGRRVFPGWHRPQEGLDVGLRPSFDRAVTEDVITWAERTQQVNPHLITTFTWDGDVLVCSHHDGEQVHVENITPDADGRYAVGAPFLSWQLTSYLDVEAWMELSAEMAAVFYAARDSLDRFDTGPGAPGGDHDRLARALGYRAVELFLRARPLDEHQPLDPIVVMHAGLHPAPGAGGGAASAERTWANLSDAERRQIMDLAIVTAIGAPGHRPAPRPPSGPAPIPEVEQPVWAIEGGQLGWLLQQVTDPGALTSIHLMIDDDDGVRIRLNDGPWSQAVGIRRPAGTSARVPAQGSTTAGHHATTSRPRPAPSLWGIAGDQLAWVLEQFPDPGTLTSLRLRHEGGRGVRMSLNEGPWSRPVGLLLAGEAPEHPSLQHLAGAGEVVIVLSRGQAEALSSSFESAERGRADFEYLAGLGEGDYEPDDILRVRLWHQRQVSVEQSVLQQIHRQVAHGLAPASASALIGLIEWPSDESAYPDMLVGAGSPQELDRMFVARLRHKIGVADPGELGEDELEQFVRRNGWPGPAADDDEVLTWLRAMRTDLISTCCSIWHVTGRGLAEATHVDRYTADSGAEQD